MRAIGAAFRTLFFIALVGGITSAVAAAVARNRMFSRGEPADDELDLVAIYDSLDFQSHAPTLRRARVTTWYGGGTVDLRGATLDPAGATLTIRALFGGLRLIVPQAWRLEQKTVAVFGGIGDARPTASVGPEGPALTIDGFAVFGGVAIVSDSPDLDREDEISEPIGESLTEQLGELAATPA
ncbi:MAG: hypothetical protein L0221_19165 [Chloroflexi bacterium]|nr:hypothetical protein [Chloroflexota bacterium]